MPRGRKQQYFVNWELLRREAAQQLRSRPGWLALGLAGPLLITLYTLLREWDLRHSVRDLLQAALFFAAWNIGFAILYAVAEWLRPRQDKAEREQLHLPLSSGHFALRRLLRSSAVPLSAALLSLPLWAILLVYYGLPYGEDFNQTVWRWMLSTDVPNPWWTRMAWLAAAILSAALLPAALAAWLNELTPLRYLRCLLMLGLPAGLYFAVNLATGSYNPAAHYGAHYGPLLMNYRQTRGVDPLPYSVLLALCLFGPLLIGWLRPAWRWALLMLPVLCFGLFMLRQALPESARARLRPVSSAVLNRDARYAAALYLGHLSPPKNIRLLLYSYPSNVLFASSRLGPEPQYPEWPAGLNWPQQASFPNETEEAAAIATFEAEQAHVQAKYDLALEQYHAELAEWEAAYARAPRLALWVCAGLYPLLLPLWASAGLLLGIALRNEPPREPA